jgi:NAD+ synthase (glutamine-hydrolysing)
MCDLVVSALEAGNMQVESDTRRLLCEEGLVLPISRQQLANRIFHTVYMGTENSSNATLQRARRLAESIGAYHIPISIDTIVRAIQVVFTVACARSPKYECDGGTAAEDLALQNIQVNSIARC